MGTATNDRHNEIARQAAMGVPTEEIAESVGIKPNTVSKIRHKEDVEERIGELQGGRDKAVVQLQEEMLQRRIRLADKIWKDLDTEYDNVRMAGEFNAKLSFNILDRTEGIPAKKLHIESTPAVFSSDDIRKANEAAALVEETKNE